MAMLGAALIGAAATAYSASQSRRGSQQQTSGEVSPPKFRPETEPLLTPMGQTAAGKLDIYNQWMPYYLQGAMGGTGSFLSGQTSPYAGMTNIGQMFGAPVQMGVGTMPAGGGGWTTGGGGWAPSGTTYNPFAAPSGGGAATPSTPGNVPSATNLYTQEMFNQEMQGKYQSYKDAWKRPYVDTGEGGWQEDINATVPTFEEWANTQPGYWETVGGLQSQLPTDNLGSLWGQQGQFWSPQLLSSAYPAYTPYQDQGENALINMGIGNVANILGGQYDPVQNPLGFLTAYQTAANPLIQSFKEETMPALGAEAMKMGGYSGSGAILARQLAADRLNTQLGNLAGTLFGQERQLGAGMLGQALGTYLPGMTTMGPSMQLARSQAEAGQYAPLMAGTAYGAAQYNPLLAAITASYAPVSQQMTLAQQMQGMMQPQWSDILNLLQATSGGASSTQMSTVGQSPNYVAAALQGLSGGLNAYKGYSDLMNSMGGWGSNTGNIGGSPTQAGMDEIYTNPVYGY